jgi:hypothetical protein
MWRCAETRGKERVNETRRLPLEHVARSLGRDVARGQSGTAGRNDERRVGKGGRSNRRGDGGPIVGHDLNADGGFGPELKEAVAEKGAGGVRRVTCGSTVAYDKHDALSAGPRHGPVV